jgi:PhnB protein
LDRIAAGSGVLPHLNITDGRCAEAIDFYAAAFGAIEVECSPGPGGKLYHARMDLNGGALLLHDDFPEMRGGTPAPAPAGVVLHLQVDDADRLWAQAIAAGCTVKFALADMFWGDRYGQLTDPYGHDWSIASPAKEGEPG